MSLCWSQWSGTRLSDFTVSNEGAGKQVDTTTKSDQDSNTDKEDDPDLTSFAFGLF